MSYVIGLTVVKDLGMGVTSNKMIYGIEDINNTEKLDAQITEEVMKTIKENKLTGKVYCEMEVYENCADMDELVNISEKKVLIDINEDSTGFKIIV